MKTATKAALIVACSLLVAGLIICGIAYAWGGDNLGIIVSRKGITRASGQFIEKHVDTGAFHSITADMSLGTVRLEASDRYGVSYGYAPDYGTPACVVEGDQLRFTMEARNVFGINMLLHRPRENYVTIYYPQGAALGDVQLRANAGNVHIAGVTSDTLRVTADLGQVSLAQAQCGAVSLEMHAGDGKLTDVQANTLQADCNLGNMTFTRVVADSFHADADAGDIRLQDCRTGETELSCDLGNMQGDGLEIDVYKRQFTAPACSLYRDTSALF